MLGEWCMGWQVMSGRWSMGVLSGARRVGVLSDVRWVVYGCGG